MVSISDPDASGASAGFIKKCERVPEAFRWRGALRRAGWIWVFRMSRCRSFGRPAIARGKAGAVEEKQGGLASLNQAITPFSPSRAAGEAPARALRSSSTL
jgi:hypothetical protein